MPAPRAQKPNRASHFLVSAQMEPQNGWEHIEISGPDSPVENAPSPESIWDQPFPIALVIDVSGSMGPVLPRRKKPRPPRRFKSKSSRFT